MSQFYKHPEKDVYVKWTWVGGHTRWPFFLFQRLTIEPPAIRSRLLRATTSFHSGNIVFDAVGKSKGGDLWGLKKNTSRLVTNGSVIIFSDFTDSSHRRLCGISDSQLEPLHDNEMNVSTSGLYISCYWKTR